jgi:AraC-like DNA-binding protein
MEEELWKKLNTALRYLDDSAECGAVVHFIDEQQPIVGKTFCRLCKACVFNDKSSAFCRHNATTGAYHSLISGQVYYAECWLGLSFLVAPIAPDGKRVIGALEIGGLLPHGRFHEIQHHIWATLSAIDENSNLQHFLSALQGLEEIPIVNIENLKNTLLDTMVVAKLLNRELFNINEVIWTRQEKLSNTAPYIKSLSIQERREKIFTGTNTLLSALESGDETLLLSQIDAILSFAAGGIPNDIKSVKAFLMISISAIATHFLLKKEKWSKVIMRLTMRIENMAKIDDMKELCYWFEMTIMNIFRKSEKMQVEELLSEKVIEFIYKHYGEDIQISDISKAVGASSSSIMHKLKSETGRTFSMHLNDIRIKEAKRLLSFTSLSLGEISLRCGFKDQSYFTKVFKKNLNLTPKEFRMMLNLKKIHA